MSEDLTLTIIADTAVAEELLSVAEDMVERGAMTDEDAAETLAGFITFRVEDEC